VPIVHVAEAHCVAVMWSWTHISVVPLAMAQDAVVPLGAFFIDVISAVLLALTTKEPLLALTSPSIDYMFIVPFLGHMSDRGVIDEGGTDSMTITPCRSSNVAVVGTVVMMSLVMSLYGVISMATIVCGG
jgi:hypothetical protein